MQLCFPFKVDACGRFGKMTSQRVGCRGQGVGEGGGGGVEGSHCSGGGWWEAKKSTSL